MSTDDNGIVCGESGTIRKTTNGGNIPTGIQTIGSEIPQSFSLEQNYPNPFNPSTPINFNIPIAGNGLDGSGIVSLRIYDMLGKEIAVLVNENLTAGSYSVDFNASSLPSGTYFYRLQSGSFIETKKMILIK